ncbi:YijD family membrane protein [Vibrio sp. DW001]|uniref:YijD family membrane protein n=1 Tax=unclassified Vibrio TaxID=2614977 RepID=UPI0023AFED66|nr:YijD family membrane protein [Vibrio sp. DW001]WED26585.1 YijD family membrane protein [Vibrio sp. DW001]
MSNESNPTKSDSARKTLLLAVIVGMCSNALLSVLTVTEVAFSIFPLIALVLSVQMLYQNYLRNPVSEELPLVGLACFFVGAFGYSAFIKAQYPGAGSNFFAIIVTLLLLLWVGKKLGFIAKGE